jgi:8-oxo-dGTP diphosphatase
MKAPTSQEDYYKTLPTKRVGVAVLLFDDSGKILVVKPNYKEGWQVPGGEVEENESPREGAIRETHEEIGVFLKDLEFLGVEYKSVNAKNFDFLEFMFSGGILTKEEIANIVLQKEELDEFKFVEIKQAPSLFRTSLRRRLPLGLEALRTGIPTYSEF